ncbi:unnamed protein product [Protopolystoma xenopodis]|uniref:Uncharacterized protein n=1 Tax=Protopolystoma xenopodis TaxID=117903 RepID=A0A3S5CCL2_9PLAT|nr:unnamed protein product [Protopolystoma xenopodis]
MSPQIVSVQALIVSGLSSAFLSPTRSLLSRTGFQPRLLSQLRCFTEPWTCRPRGSGLSGDLDSVDFELTQPSGIALALLRLLIHRHISSTDQPADAHLRPSGRPHASVGCFPAEVKSSCSTVEPLSSDSSPAEVMLFIRRQPHLARRLLPHLVRIVYRESDVLPSLLAQPPQVEAASHASARSTSRAAFRQESSSPGHRSSAKSAGLEADDAEAEAEEEEEATGGQTDSRLVFELVDESRMTLEQEVNRYQAFQTVRRQRRLQQRQKQQFCQVAEAVIQKDLAATGTEKGQ